MSFTYFTVDLDGLIYRLPGSLKSVWNVKQPPQALHEFASLSFLLKQIHIVAAFAWIMANKIYV